MPGFRGFVRSAATLLWATACGSRQTAAPVQIGQTAPDVMLADETGRVRTLAEYRGNPVVLYFYPRDATPGCTREACAFRDAWTDLQATGATVLGVSTDSVESHRRFQQAHQLPFHLLADVEGKAAQAYGVPVRLGFTSRVTFLIDRNGQVAATYPDVDPGVHAAEILRALRALPSS